MDTVSDFCAYLRKKEELISNCIVGAGGEEELLGLYLKKMDSDGTHGFGIDTSQYGGVFVSEGEWLELQRNAQYLSKKQADKVSYIWDRFIEYFNECHATGNIRRQVETKDYERAIRHMAAFNRVERRVAGQRLKHILETTGPDDTRYSAIVTEEGKKAFAFVLFSPRADRSYDEYLTVRLELLAAYSNILKLKTPALREVIGIALEPSKPGRGGSEDLAYFDYCSWSDEQRRQAKEDMEALGIRAQGNYFSEEEYPTQ